MPEPNWRQSIQATGAIRQSVTFAPQPSRTSENLAEWQAFRGLRGQVEDVYSRVSKMEEELSLANKNHETVVSAMQGQMRETADKNKQLISDLQAEVEEGRSRLNSFTDILNRKVEQVMRLELELQQEKSQSAQRRDTVTSQSTEISNLKAELESSRISYRNTKMCLEYSEKKVEDLLANVASLEKERDQMFGLLRAAHEQEIDALAQVYAQREAVAVQSHNDGLEAIQREYAAATTHLQKQLAASYQADIDRLRKELATVKAAWTKEKEEWAKQTLADREVYTAHAKAEVVELTARIDRKEQRLLEEYQKKEKALDDRIARDRIDRAREAQEVIIQQRAREAEIRATFEIQVENIDKKASEARQAQLVEYQRELTRLAEHHRQMERELEKLHREKEKEMASRYRLAGGQMSDAMSEMRASAERAEGKDEITRKLDAAAEARRERSESFRKQLQEK